MNQSGLQVVLLLILASGLVSHGPEAKPGRQSDKRSAESGWPALEASMQTMHMAMSATQPSGDSDLDFVQLMLPHHQAALDMAKAQLLYGKDAQMRRLAQEIITDQQSEMDLMQLWLKEYGSRSLNEKPAGTVKQKSEEH